MKKNLLVTIACLIYVVPNAQITTSTNWTWVKGSKEPNASSVHGVKGIPDPANIPGARSGGVSWKDASGNLWMFGGDYEGVLYNDLWKYNPGNNQWTWVNGDNSANAKAVYGDKGVESHTNKPGARHWAASWVDAGGNFWLSGGAGFGTTTASLLNDLWKYNPATNAWTWVSGDSIVNGAPNYGTQGVTAGTNKPGARLGSVGWIDVSGKLYLFGGRGYSTDGGGSLGNLNDLWKYDPVTNQWTWIKGDNFNHGTAVYGTKGVANAANKPSGRYESVGWTDATGNFWLFGGLTHFTISGTSYDYNDLWKYNPLTNEWTWVNGANTINTLGTYGTQGTESPTNQPGSRHEAMGWKDNLGNFWLFGGFYGSSGSVLVFNDLWKYNPLSNQWTWMKGDNTSRNYGIYGTQGVAAASNKPGSRYSGVSWTDNVGNLWLFGGNGSGETTTGMLNDLWGLGSNGVLPVTLIGITARLRENMVQVDWKTAQEINSSHFVVERSADGRNFSGIGTVTAAGNSFSVKNYSFTDGQPLDGDNYYRARMVDKDSSFRYSAIVKVFAGEKHAVSIYPNPVKHIATLTINSAINAMAKICVYDSKGVLINVQEHRVSAGNNQLVLTMPQLAKGIYTAKITWGSLNETLKIVKE